MSTHSLYDLVQCECISACGSILLWCTVCMSISVSVCAQVQSSEFDLHACCYNKGGRAACAVSKRKTGMKPGDHVSLTVTHF